MSDEQYQLVVMGGSEHGRTFQLGLDAVIIGRDEFSDIVFDHPEVSRHHARLTAVGGAYVLQDLGSTNGTFIEGTRLGGDPVILKPGQTIRLGGAVSLSFERAPQEEPAPETVPATLVATTMVAMPGTLPEVHDTVQFRPGEVQGNPFVGPRAFEPDERQFFYGRDDEIAILAGQVMSRRVSLFFAQSGAGKSSLLRAGLIPDLTRQVKVGRGPRARVVQKMRVMPILEVGYNPTDEQMESIDNVYVLGALLSLDPEKPVEELASLTLCQGLATYFDRPDQGPSGNGRAGKGAGSTKPSAPTNLSTLLIFDQFEELFTYHPEQWPKREDFFRQVNQALEEYPDLHVVFTMREDFIAELTPYASLLPDQLRARFRLERLKRDAALKAIVAPAEKAGRTFAKGVAEELVDNLRRGQAKQNRSGDAPAKEAELGAYVEPVHLQIVCRQLWENLPARRIVIEAVDVQAFGDVDQALTGFYEATLAEVTALTEISPRRLRAWFDEKVITPARTRGLVYRGEEETEGLPNTAVNILNDAYIIRADVRGGDVWYELAHDRLVEPVLEANVIWRENYDNPLDKATRAWLAAGRDRGRLLDGAQLADAQAYADENPQDVLPEEQEFLVESRLQEQMVAEQAERQAQRRRRTRIVAGVVGTILLVATIFAVVMAIQANQAKKDATAQALEADKSREEAEYQATEARRAEESALAAEEEAVAAADEANRAQAEAARERDNAQQQQQEADRQRNMAEIANALAEVSRLSRDVNDPSLPLIMAREALKIADDADGTLQNTARRVLLDSVATAPPWLMNLPPQRHDAQVLRAAFSPDGERIVSASEDGTAKVWNLATGEVLLTLAEYGGVVNSAVFSPDGGLIVTGSDDGMARIWDATTGESLETLAGHDNWVDHAAFDPSGERIVTAGADGIAKVWDVATGDEILALEGHGDGVTSADSGPQGERFVTAANFDPQGERIVTAGGDGTARVWDAQSGEELLVLKGHENLVAWAVFSDAGDRIATASSDGTARVWDAKSGEVIAIMEGDGYQEGYAAPIVSAMFSSDGQQVVTANWDGSGSVWDADSGELLYPLYGHAGTVNFADFSPDDRSIMTTGEDKTIRIWDASTTELLSTLGGSGGQALDVAFGPDSARVAVAIDDGTVIIWDVVTGEALARIEAQEFGANAVEFSPDGRRIVTAGWGGVAQVWDADSGAALLPLEGHDDFISDVAFNPDGTAIATVGQDGKLLVWNAETGNLIASREGADDYGGVNSVAFSPDGQQIVTSGEGGEVKIWVANSLELLLNFYANDPLSAVFSPDGSRLLTGGTDRTAVVWDASSGEALLTLIGHKNWVRTAAFSPDGAMIVTASDDTTARLWDAESGQELRTLSGHGGWLTSATFSPDMRLVASSDRSGVTKLWDLTAPALIPELQHDGSSIGQSRYTPDGRHLVTVDGDNLVKIWDSATGQELLSISGFLGDLSDASTSVAILPAEDDDGVLSLWDTSSGEIASTVAGNAVWVDRFILSDDGQVALTVGCDEYDDDIGACVARSAKVWDSASGDELLSIPFDFSYEYFDFKLSRDGSHLVMSACLAGDDDCNDGQLMAWNTTTGEELLSIPFNLSYGGFELSRDGGQLVTSACTEPDDDSGCLDAQLIVWDTTTGAEITRIEGLQGEFWQLEFSPEGSKIFAIDWESVNVLDSATGELIRALPGTYGTIDNQGERLVTLGFDFRATIWDVGTGDELATLIGHRDGINSIEFSPDGQYLITASWDGTARVWNATTGIEILALTEHQGQVWDAHFSPDGRSIVTASEDGRALVWPFSIDRLLELSEPVLQRYSPFLTPQELARFGLSGNQGNAE